MPPGVRPARGFSRAAFIINFGQWASVLAVYLLSLMLISRLMDKTEIGRFGLAAAVYAVLAIVGSFGAERYLVQVRAFGPSCVAAAFGLSLAASAAGSVLLLAFAQPIAALYHDPGLAPLVRIVALALLVTPLHATLQGLLQREMQFGRLYAVNTGATIAGAATGVLLAWGGWGAAALAWGLAVEVSAKAFIAFVCCPKVGFAWPRRGVWRDAARFGGAALGVNLLTAVGDSMPALLTGRMLSIEAVGLLNRAQRMVLILQDAVQKSAKTVALPALSAGHRTPAALRSPYLLKISYLTGLAWPAFLVIAVLAAPIVHVMLGPQWEGAIPILRVLALGGLFLPFVAMNISFFTVLERLDIMMRLQAWLLPARFGILAAACWHGDLATLAAALVAVQGLRAAVLSRSLAGLLSLPPGATWAVAAPSVVPAAAAGIAALLVALSMPMPGPASGALGGLALLALACPAAGLAWLAVIGLGRHPLSAELQVLRTWLRSVLKAEPARPVA